MRHRFALMAFLSLLGCSVATINVNAADAPAPSTTASVPAAADSSASMQTHFKVLPPTIKPVQSGEDMSKAAPDYKTADGSQDKLDSLTPRSGYSEDFWKNADGKNIAAFLKAPAPKIMSPTTRHMLIGAIITPAKDTAVTNAYTMRLAKLVEIGDFSDALSLYKLNEGPAPNPTAARAGVEAMVGTGQMAVACLEQKVLPHEVQSENPEMWTNLSVFCQSMFGPASAAPDADGNNVQLDNAARILVTSHKFDSPKTVDELNSYDVTRLLALLRSSSLSSLLKDGEKLSVLSDKTLSALIGGQARDRDVKFALLNEGLRRGLVDESVAKANLSMPAPSPIAKTKGAAAIPADKWEAFLNLYNAKEFAPSPLIITEATKLKAINLLTYKAAAFEKASTVSGFNAADSRNVLILLAETNHNLSSAWVQQAFPTAKSEKSANNEKLLTDILLSLKKADKLGSARLLAISASFDDTALSKEQYKATYDNIFSLTASGNYVMPMDENLSSLQKSADKKLVSQVVIESINILSATPLDKIHPAALFRILQALDSAGLNEEAVSLAHEVLGDIVRKD